MPQSLAISRSQACLLQAGADVNDRRAELGRLDMVKDMLTLSGDIKKKNSGQYRRTVFQALKS